MNRTPDFSDEILAYLRERRGQLVETYALVVALTAQVKDRTSSRQRRGRVLSEISRLIREKKVIRYRKPSMVHCRARSSQGLLRISELAA